MVSGTVFDFQAYVQDKRCQLEACLTEYLSGGEPGALWDSMRYSVLSGGKRIRAMLCFAAAEAVAGEGLLQADTATRPEGEEPSGRVAGTRAKRATEQASGASHIVMPCACAIEMVHAMSLIHDDLPVMDNDDFRRGRPTNHRVYGEALALLAGDALLVRATEVLARHTPPVVERAALIEVIGELARASGALGLVGGQVDDLAFTGQLVHKLSGETKTKPNSQAKGSAQSETTGGGETTVDENTLRSIHRRKTGALLSFSSWSGAYLAGARGDVADAFRDFGELLGLAFQITDDLLDVTGDIETLGKTPGKDEKAQKTTWVRMFGVERSRQHISDIKVSLAQLLKETGIPSGRRAALEAIAEYAVNRVN
jgi:geranylgeranyl diphosphate synthase type II